MSHKIPVTIMVPASEIDFSQCDLIALTDTTEMHGAVQPVQSFDYDLSGATWNGHSVDFPDDDAAFEELKKERGF